jgi:uncharacterized protein (TIGR00255 family)
METFSKDDYKIRLNTALADAYMEQFLIMANRYPVYPQTISLQELAKYPDIFAVEKNLADENTQAELWETLLPALREALLALNNMRTAEGTAMYHDIMEKRGGMIGILQKIKEKAPFVAAEYGSKLRARLAEAFNTAGVDEARLLMEITIMADKACVDEEITRLESLFDQLEEVLNANEAIGRKLDFLIQEINREVNTIASKSNDLEITRYAVSLKSEVEKIREQTQNIE